MSPIKIGFVGLSAEGWAGATLVKGLLATPLSDLYTLTAVSTRTPESATAAANKYAELTKQPIQAFHGDTSQIANDPRVELVAVSVRAPSHTQAAMPVIESGKNLFIEWPCGGCLHEAERLLEAAKRKGIKTMVGLQGIQSPVIRKAKELVSSGRIGRVLSTSVLLRAPKEHKFWGPQTSQRTPYVVDENNGATMLDIAVGHFIGCFIPVLGDFSSVTATAHNQYPTAIEVDGAGNPTGKTWPQTAATQIAVSGILKSGAVVNIHCRGGLSSTPGRASLVWIIDGEEGSIKIQNDSPSGSFIQIALPTLYLNGEEVKIDQDGNLDNVGRAWMEFAKGAEGDYPSLEDAVNVHRVVDGIRKSAKEGRKIDI